MHRIAVAGLLAAGLAGCGAEPPPRPAQVPPAAPIEQPRALARVAPEQAFALAGDAALLAGVRGRDLAVRALPLAGGAGRVVFRFRAPKGAVPEARLSASAQRAGLVVTTADDGSTLRATQPFSGPVGGPWEPLAPLTELAPAEFFPAGMAIEGERIVLVEIRGDITARRFTVRDPGAEPVAVPEPDGVYGTDFAGDLIAYTMPVRGQPADDDPRRVVIRNWRTGAQVATAVLRGGIEAYDLRPDGGVVLSQEGGGVHVVRPGAAPRELTRRGTEARWAGEHILFRAGDGRLRVIDPGGRARDFGAPSALIESFVTDDRRVLWGANGCLLVADVTARAARAPAPGPCPRSEVAMRDGQPLVNRSRRVPVRLRCVAAAPPGCRGTLRLELDYAAQPLVASRRLRFHIPTGRARWLRPRLTRRAWAAARREARTGIGGAGMQVVAVTVDPAGRRSRLSDGYSIDVPRSLIR